MRANDFWDDKISIQMNYYFESRIIMTVFLLFFLLINLTALNITLNTVGNTKSWKDNALMNSYELLFVNFMNKYRYGDLVQLSDFTNSILKLFLKENS